MEPNWAYTHLKMDKKQIEATFAKLQKKMFYQWENIRQFSNARQTVVVIPSLTVDIDLKPALQQAYEERFLFLLLLLRQPNTRIIYLTSQIINPTIIEYYLQLLPGIIPSHARRRLTLLTPHDIRALPLTVKILQRPNLIARIRELIPDLDAAHIVAFTVTEMERELAIRLGIPIFGTNPRLTYLGSKSGGREVFQSAGVSYPLGKNNLRSFEDVIAAIVELRAQKPSIAKVVIKQNTGVSGFGNALLDLKDLPVPGDPHERSAITRRLSEMGLGLAGQKIEQYIETFNINGGIIEEFISGKEIHSPSVQMRITPIGMLQIISTTDQELGGHLGHTYVGCRFPADPRYAVLISQEAQKIGEYLLQKGVLGRFAVDFIVVKDENSQWKSYAIEINIRKGGTTHPFLTMKFLTDGFYYPDKAIFISPSGKEKSFIANDNLCSPHYRCFTPSTIFDIAVHYGLHFNQTDQTGVVFHMLSSLGTYGRLGVTAVSDSLDQASLLMNETVDMLDQEATKAQQFELH